MAAMTAAGSQVVFIPGCEYATGGLTSGRLLVVPVGVCLPPGALRLAASSCSTARPRRGLLPSSALPCVSTASARRGLFHASASPVVPRSISSAIRAPEPAVLAQSPQSTHRSRTVAYGGHDPATGAGDDADVSEDNGADASPCKNDRARVSKEKKDGAFASKAKAKDDAARASRENGGAFEEDGAFAYEAKDDGAHASGENGGVFKDAGSFASKSKDDGARTSREKGGVFKDDGCDDSAEENPKASKDDGGAGFEKLNAKVSKDDGGGRRSWKENNDDDAADGVVDEGALQVRVDPRIIVAQVHQFGLAYDPLENIWSLSTMSRDKAIVSKWANPMRDCQILFRQAMQGRPPLAEHALELVLIGNTFRVVSKEVQTGFVQSLSILRAIHGLKAMGNIYLGPYNGFLKPIPPLDFPLTPPDGTSEQLYFKMLLDYYNTVFDCLLTEISGWIDMDGLDDHFQGLR